MAGFETIVRPAIVPNIRPSAAQKIVAFADPEQGFAVIHGNPAKELNLTTTTSISISRSQGTEVQRRVDRVRIYQVDEQGNINKENFVDVDVANRLRVRTAGGTETTWYRRALQPGEAGTTNIELIKRDIIFNTRGGGNLGSG